MNFKCYKYTFSTFRFINFKILKFDDKIIVLNAQQLVCVNTGQNTIDILKINIEI